MAVPTVTSCLAPLLRVLALEPAGLGCGLAQDRVAQALGLSAEDMASELPSGGAAFRNRVAWAQVRLKRAGLTHSPAKGVWGVTTEGRAILALGADAAEDRLRRALGGRGS